MKEIHKLLSFSIYFSPERRYVFLGPFVPFRWMTQQEEVVMTSRPVGQEGRCSLVVCSSPWPRKKFDWNGDVATRVAMRTTEVKFFKKYLFERMSDPGKIIRFGR